MGQDGPPQGGPRRDDARGGPPQRGPRQGTSSREPGRGDPRRVVTPDPQLPDDVTGQELDRDVRHELGTLPRDAAVTVARHLVVTGRLLDLDPEAAYRHAMAAQRRAGRIGSVREAAGLAAYRAGRYEEALRELRAARRLTGSDVHWPVMADCERGLGRPERAVSMASAPEVDRLDRDGLLEMRLVVAGARTDLGQPDAAVLTLQVPELTSGRSPVRARLLSAYADALAAAGREDEARSWLGRAAAADVDGTTGAAARFAGRAPADQGEVAVWDLLDGELPDGELPDGELPDGDLPARRHGAASDGTDGTPRSTPPAPAD